MRESTIQANRHSPTPRDSMLWAWIYPCAVKENSIDPKHVARLLAPPVFKPVKFYELCRGSEKSLNPAVRPRWENARSSNQIKSNQIKKSETCHPIVTIKPIPKLCDKSQPPSGRISPKRWKSKPGHTSPKVVKIPNSLSEEPGSHRSMGDL
jgi:hypothetical protein